ncbi:hypothetical protein FHW12_000313 [Dokdonella fugitiva]|uniref:Uncharacterized protein n=1 Tax=Dokdonella fugitiva TaxID=328517 RepID=A0A839EWG8_9GAMM|nr:hypothetical protein [Dokdonella fugitiva]MBA8886122.1 hypothetical protein [Dokdonella fugitiva]
MRHCATRLDIAADHATNEVSSIDHRGAARELRVARARVESVIAVSAAYFRDFCVDESRDELVTDPDGKRRGRITGCSAEQHEAAKRLRAALVQVGAL